MAEDPLSGGTESETLVNQPRLNGLELDHVAIAALCDRHRITRLSAFGSVLRKDFAPESDLDLLVEFEPGQTPGFEFVGIQEELSELLQREVDLLTPNFLSRYIRERVLKEARPIFVR